MEKEIITSGAQEESSVINTTETPAFKGFTISELRYRRALTAVKRNYVLEQLMVEKNRVTSLSFLSSGKKNNNLTRIISRSAPVLTTITKGLSYIDYISIGMSLFGTGKKIFSWFKKKK